jgi:hypothetical protein
MIHYLTSAALILMSADRPTDALVPRPAELVLQKSHAVRGSVKSVSRELIQIATDEAQLPEMREGAIRALAELQGKESIRPLLRILTFRGRVGGEIGPLQKYPAAVAISGFGSNVYRDVWGFLSNECTEQELYVLAWALVQFDGKECVALRVKHAISDPKNGAATKENLRRLGRILERVDFNDHRQWPD